LKTVAIIVVVLMILAGAAMGVMNFLEIGPFAVVDPDQVEEVSDEDHIFIAMDPLIVNVFSGNKIIATLRVSLKLDTVGDDNASFVNNNLPKISDYLFRDMHAFLPRIISPEDGSLDIFLLKKRLKMAADKLYPVGQINDVMI